MDDTEKPDNQAEKPASESPVVGAAKVIGSVVGKVASLVGAGGAEAADTAAPPTPDTAGAEPAVPRAKPAPRPRAKAPAPVNTPPKKPVKQKENLYQAEYMGSGTFKITKAKRTKAKRRQSALKNRRRGSRK
ncbi:MAG: hypothetical protein JWO48_816 [Bryobacterales bacterium]|nr:hypothetical protein [Bryobacterales bacterium]